MGAFIEQRDGYGWTTANGTMDADENGAFDKLGTDYDTKTIYLDAETGSPMFVSKTIRVYWITGTPTLSYYTTGFIHDYGASDALLTKALTSGYVDIVFEGYQQTAGTDIVIFFKCNGANELSIYINTEAGY